MSQSSAVNPAMCPHCGRLLVDGGSCAAARAPDYYDKMAIDYYEKWAANLHQIDIQRWPAARARNRRYEMLATETSKFPWGDQ